MKEDIKLINSSKNIFLSADETQNFYEIKGEDYVQIVHENVTKAYRKADISFPKWINREVKNCKNIEGFITLKNQEG